MKVQLTCMYCAFTWTEVVYNQSAIEDMICKKIGCKDSNLIVRDVTNKIDYYMGCPAFVPKTDNSFLKGA